MNPIIAKSNLLKLQTDGNLSHYTVNKSLELRPVSKLFQRFIRWIRNICGQMDRRVQQAYRNSMRVANLKPSNSLQNKNIPEIFQAIVPTSPLENLPKDPFSIIASKLSIADGISLSKASTRLFEKTRHMIQDRWSYFKKKYPGGTEYFTSKGDTLPGHRNLGFERRIVSYQNGNIIIDRDWISLEHYYLF